MNITFNGKPIEVQENQTVLHAARDNGIYIPTLCDSPHLPPYGACRLCLVEVKGQRGYVPSCSTIVRDGMEVVSDTPKLRKTRRQILELILSEHPSACLICREKENCDEYKSTIRKVEETTGCVLCPNNGRCDLQDVVNALKVDSIRFPAQYRDIEIKKKDPFFDRNYNLCILCGRCVRVCHELRGASAITFAYRGSEAVISTVLDRPLLDVGCQFCGACVDVCPTGSLTERSLKYERMPDAEAETVCSLCSMGCRLEVSTFGGRILSARPSEEGPVNQGQACVKGRFLIRDAVYSERRIRKPLIRKKKDLEEVSWEEALGYAAKELKKFSGDEIGCISSAQISCEDAYVFEQFAGRVLKSPNIAAESNDSMYAAMEDWSVETGFDLPLNFKIEDIEKADTIVLAGADIAASHPLVWLAVLQAVKNGAKLITASPVDLQLSRYTAVDLRIKTGMEALLFSGLAKAVLEGTGDPKPGEGNGSEEFIQAISAIKIKDILKIAGLADDAAFLKAAELLQPDRSAALILGEAMLDESAVKSAAAASWNLARLIGGRLYLLGEGSNARGRLAVRTGKGIKVNPAELTRRPKNGGVQALYLAAGSAQLPEKWKPAFLIVQDAYWSREAERANVVFPACTFAETEGTYVNAEGRLQRSMPVIAPVEEAKPDWWIFSCLAKKMGAKDIAYSKLSEIRAAIKKEVPALAGILSAALGKSGTVFLEEDQKIDSGFLPIDSGQRKRKTSAKYPFLLLSTGISDRYRGLDLAGESRGLAQVRNAGKLFMHPEDAAALDLQNGGAVVVRSRDGSREAVVNISKRVPPGVLQAYSLEGLMKGARFASSPVVLPVSIERGE